MHATEYIDAHCHLNLGDLAPDKDAAWSRAQAAGVTQAIVVGIDPETSREVVDFCSTREGLHPSVGVHPTESAKQGEGAWPRIVALAGEAGVVAIGETGIDLYWKDSPLDVQQLWLERQAKLALDRDLPLILHIRDGFKESVEVLEPFAERGLRAQVHCFTGGPDDLEPFLSWGFYISYSGILTFPKAKALRRAAQQTPRNRLLVETDAPWLAPAPHRGQRNEPAFVTHTTRCLADLFGEDCAAMARITAENATRLFRLPVPDATSKSAQCGH